MDITKKIRPVSILCATESHGYCLSSINEHCECSCHFVQEATVANWNELSSIGIQLWRLSGGFGLMTDEERRAHVLTIVRNAEGSVDFHGFTAEEVAERFEPTMARGYWSLRETNEDFGLDGYTGEPKGA